MSRTGEMGFNSDEFTTNFMQISGLKCCVQYKIMNGNIMVVVNCSKFNKSFKAEIKPINAK